jgi:hypothetical protein
MHSSPDDQLNACPATLRNTAHRGSILALFFRYGASAE